MERKSKIPFGGKLVDGVELDFSTKREEWNEYEVSDGSIIRMKLVVTNIIRTGEFDVDGNPVYVVKSSNVLGVSAPESLKRGSTVS